MSKEKFIIKDLGAIHLGEKVFVTDPCYETSTWCQAELHNVSPGTYKCFIILSDEGTWGYRVAELHAVKEEFLRTHGSISEIPYSIDPFPATIGVDSGQCGIFEAKYYEHNQPDNNYDNPDSWYKKVCNITCSSAQAGTVDNSGVVTSSGFGDGCYSLYTAKEKDKIVAMKVVFIE